VSEKPSGEKARKQMEAAGLDRPEDLWQVREEIEAANLTRRISDLLRQAAAGIRGGS
jgi:hypothetical protein